MATWRWPENKHKQTQQSHSVVFGCLWFRFAFRNSAAGSGSPAFLDRPSVAPSQGPRAPGHVHQRFFGGSTLGFFQSLSPQGPAVGMCLHGLSMGILIEKWRQLEHDWIKMDQASYLGLIFRLLEKHLKKSEVQEFSTSKVEHL